MMAADSVNALGSHNYNGTVSQLVKSGALRQVLGSATEVLNRTVRELMFVIAHLHYDYRTTCMRSLYPPSSAGPRRHVAERRGFHDASVAATMASVSSSNATFPSKHESSLMMVLARLVLEGGGHEVAQELQVLQNVAL
jgi:hypothetical protein